MRLVLCLAALLVAAPAHAMTATPNGTQWTIDYREPSTNSDGSALQDLIETRARYQIGRGSTEVCAVVPATQPQGGGSITTTCTVPIEGKVETTVTFTAVAVDDAQPVPNVSAPSDPIVKDYDTLDPGKPE